MTKVSFQEWFNNADIPGRDSEGRWVDWETGFAYEDCNNTPKKVKIEKTDAQKRYGDSKVVELKKIAQRLVSNQEYAVKKYSDSYDVSALEEVVEIGKNIDKMKKSELLSLIEMNSKASRLINNQINK